MANGVATCDLTLATIAITRTARGVLGTVDESVYNGPADTGSNFRIGSCQYAYNLSASAMGVVTQPDRATDFCLMPVNLPLLYEQLRAGIRNEVDGLTATETRFKGFSEGDTNQ
jgi:hypothetical protein